MLYPLKFKPIYKEKIWGGNKIKTFFGNKFTPPENCGELWALSGVKGDESIIENGFLAGNNISEITEIYMDELLGEEAYQAYGEEFPLLIKFIDATDDLSIQVHPNDEIAKAKHDSFGKSEMWYIMQHDKDAEIITGFNQPMTKDTYLEHFKNDQLVEILNHEKVKNGSAYYLPSGRIHAIGKGILLAEIQQSSDVTYRIFDYNRTDNQGNKRDLHVEEALQALDFSVPQSYISPYQEILNKTTSIVKSPYFHTNIIHLDKPIEKDYHLLDSFVIYTCVEGAYCLEYGQNKSIDIQCGESLLIPATVKLISILPKKNTKILESYIPFGTNIV